MGAQHLEKRLSLLSIAISSKDAEILKGAGREDGSSCQAGTGQAPMTTHSAVGKDHIQGSAPHRDQEQDMHPLCASA